ncbi:hypothetical protein CAEBREN_05321 [Caenorhabditis brenneri]|uniref:Ubiquitin-like domain-containing protein n=1 Tax=Caenorhabditis brenneri TaxID=135651 RepID=G0MMW0_CAEBE|nr:hypothetical protein CAEBREN_05321 [Caenorhabditis brenneri]
MSTRPRRKRNAQAPAPPPAIDPLHLLNPHIRIDSLKKHVKKRDTRFNKIIKDIRDVTAGRCDQQEAKMETMGAEFKKLKEMFVAMAGELKECKEKLRVLEEQAAKDRARNNDGDDDDDHDGADEFRGGHDDGNGGGMDFDDVDLGGDHTNGNNDDGSDERQDDGSGGRGDNAGANEDIDQGNDEVEESAGTEGSAPIGRGAEAMQVALMNRDQDPEGAGNRAAEPSSPDAHPGQPKAGVPKQKTFSLENLQHLLENGNILGLLEAINENLAKLTPFFAGPGIREMSEVLSKLQDVEQARIQGGTPAKRQKMDGDFYKPENLLLSDETVFYVRSFEQLYVVIMKRRQTVADLKKILEEKTGKNAENWRCFVGPHLLLDCYEVKSVIEDHCLVHVSEGNPDIQTSSSSRQ